ncbi:non-ribosomal peptide synthetase [Pedosphaera parvula]|uniref:Amino acid adenylation domain protein n=1 Tax=Pedosphaera parvula (strain Ellin514) TaxID=320771 RepID=B9XIK9_PEDPL|nr:non-ribosomal peptide synthetase [Pedosphaera parvula]EEF60272.1 amino acid adenylation domain protein [Pedosphaera parvula Ellin514]
MTISTLDSTSPEDVTPHPETGGEVYVAPPSFSQQRLWMMHQLDPASPVYVLPAAFRITGKIDVNALEGALNEILRRHEVLRTTFSFENGELMQIIAPSMELHLKKMDLQQIPETELEGEIVRLIHVEMRRPFNLAEGPLVRAALMKLSAEQHVLVLNLNHMVADGMSCGLMGRELEKLYAAFTKGQLSPLPPLPLQYADYTIWERRCMQGELLKSQLAYWKEQLGGAPPVLEIPADRPRPARQTFNGALLPIELSLSATNALKALSRREQASLFMTLLAAYKVLLFRYTGQADMLVGAPVANRGQEELEPMIGFFVNLLIFRTSLSPNQSFRNCLQQVRDVTSAAYVHKDLPFEKLVEELRPERDPSYHPLFQVMFALHAAPIDLDLIDLKCETIPVDNGAAKFDLYFELWEADGCVRGRIEYNTDLFDQSRIVRMAGHFKALLEGIVANPDQLISELPLLTEPERRQVLLEWNNTGRAFSQDQCVHELFEAQVARTPQTVALTCGQQSLSYAELNSRADRLAEQLLTWGVRPETLVGVCLERSPVLLTALLAILKAGGAYVPLDPDYPKDRLQFVLQDAHAPLLLTQKEFADHFALPDMQVVCLDKESSEVLQGPEPEIQSNDPNSQTRPSLNQLAYVLYTSGSTGRPKGVLIEHRSVVNLLGWAHELYTREELAGVLASTSVCFDLSVFEFFVPLSCGGRVILAENALELPQLPASGEVTLLNTVPSAMAELLRTRGLPASVRVVNLAGEPLSPQLVDELYRTQPCVRKVYDLYGPTEDTVYTTCALRRPGAPATIGRPLANKQVYILNEQQEPVPVGVPGELFIGGSGLARGYLHQAQLTSEKFIPHPFSADPSARLYRTGDLAAYLPDGNIEFIGRTDHQVKLRGFRIEFGEIEAVLTQHSAIREAVITLQGESSNNKQLVAYLAIDPGRTITENELHLFTRERLPDYMVPSTFLTLDALPRTPNGKIDRKALTTSGAGRLDPGQEFVSPLTTVQKQLAEIWENVLEIPQVGIHDNFFHLGGHSVLAMRVSSRMCEAFNLEISMVALFEAPTIAELAEMIEDEMLSGKAA